MKLYSICLLLVLISCNGRDSFYTTYAEEDLYRMPVIKPYQLTHLYGIEEGKHSHWELGFHYGGDKETPLFAYNDPEPPTAVPATEINVSNKIIYGYYQSTIAVNPDIWFVIIPDEKIEKVFEGREREWRDYLKQKGIDSITLHGVWPLFREYRKSYTLPWYNPKKGIYPDKNN